MPTPDDEYTNTPTRVRLWTEFGEWFVDGAEAPDKYTEACWSFDTRDEALAAMPDFVRVTSARGVEWRFDRTRPKRSRRVTNR